MKRKKIKWIKWMKSNEIKWNEAKVFKRLFFTLYSFLIKLFVVSTKPNVGRRIRRRRAAEYRVDCSIITKIIFTSSLNRNSFFGGETAAVGVVAISMEMINTSLLEPHWGTVDTLVVTDVDVLDISNKSCSRNGHDIKRGKVCSDVISVTGVIVVWEVTRGSPMSRLVLNEGLLIMCHSVAVPVWRDLVGR